MAVMRSNPAWVLLEVLGLDDATYVDPLRADEEGELGGVLDSLGERVDLEDGEAADQLLGFREGPSMTRTLQDGVPIYAAERWRGCQRRRTLLAILAISDLIGNRRTQETRLPRADLSSRC
jgi:hypothetical protein